MRTMEDRPVVRGGESPGLDGVLEAMARLAGRLATLRRDRGVSAQGRPGHCLVMHLGGGANPGG